MKHSDRPPALRELQRWMANRILPSSGAAVRADPGSWVEAWVERPRRGTLADRLGAHADGYPARLRESLADAFPAIAHVLGNSELAALTERYIAAVPPRSYNLNDAGADLARHLASDALTEGLPFLPDLARLEWKIVRAFHSRDRDPVDPTQLAGWTLEQWEHCVFRFQPSVAIVRSKWPILDLLRVVDTPREQIDLQIDGRPQAVHVFRRALEVRCELVDPDCADALELLMEGRTLGDVTRRLDDAGVAASSIQTWFASWMKGGMIVKCSLASAGSGGAADRAS